MIKPKKPLIPPQAERTFFDYFLLPADAEEVLDSFGYSFEARLCPLPQAPVAADRLAALRSRLEAGLPLISLTSETARREFLIAPVLWEVATATQAKIRVEYPLAVDPQLKGTLDYYLRGKNNLLVVEAKNADLERGFVQLAVELVALDKWLDDALPMLYGAVSIGNIWQFGLLHRRRRHVTQDLKLYRVPDDLGDLLAILTAILKNGEAASRRTPQTGSQKRAGQRKP